MESIIKKLFIIIVIPCISFSASAYDIEVDGIYYNIDASNGTAVITNGDSPYTGEIIVPDEIIIKNRNLKVISLGQAFKNTTITAISIGINISEIQFEDFEECNNLKEITFLPTESPIKIFNKYVYNDFYAHVGCFYKLPLEKVVFGRPIVLTTSESGYPFYESPFVYSNYDGIQRKCTTLKDVVFNGSCNSIPKALCANSTISTLVLGECIQEICSDSFKKCNSLKQIIIKNIDTFASIKFEDTPQNGRCLYYENGDLIKDLTLNVPMISSQAFSGVDGIESITLDNDVSSVESNAFSGMQSLKIVKIVGDKIACGSCAFGQNSQLEEIEINHLDSIGTRMFENCPLIKMISCPNVKSIGEYAFYNCTSLEEVNAPVLSSLGAYSFTNTKLNNIKLPLIAKIGDCAFANCSNLMNADFGIKTKTFGDSIFNECRNLTSITIKSPNPPSCNKSFTNFTYVNTILNVPEFSVDDYKSTNPWSNFFEITGVQLNYFEYEDCLYYIDGTSGVLTSVLNKNIETLIIPQTIRYYNENVIIGDWLDNCLKGLKSLKNLSFPSTFHELPPINNLKSLETIAVNCEHIPDNYFKDQSKLKNINLGEQIITIGKYAFNRCSSLTSIQIPATCVEIGNDAFNGCSKLSSILFEESSQTILLGYNSRLYLSSYVTPFPYPTTVDEIRTGFKNGYYDGLFYGLPIERLIINRNIELPKYYERTVGTSTSEYPTIYNDIIYYSPFYGLQHLKYVEIGENVSSICRNKIEAVVFAESTTMEYKNFGECNNIEVVQSNNPIAPIGGGFSKTVYDNAYLFIPDGSENSYKNDEFWKRFSQMSESPFIITESISFDAPNIIIDINESMVLTPIFSPENTTIKKLKWGSTSPSIVSVSEDGAITSYSCEGISLITALACDGSGSSATIKVTVQEGAGISDVSVDKSFNVCTENGSIIISGKSESEIVKVFNLQGQLITTSTSNIIDLKSKGIYIVNIGCKSKKITL